MPRMSPSPLTARGGAPSFARASQIVAAVVMLLDTLPEPSVAGVDRVYRQLGEILAILTRQ
jgi:hypothetical protein